MPNARQLEFQQGPRKQSQCDRILEHLQARAGQPVPMPELARVGTGKPHGFCMVHSRIADLRARGHVIDQTQERVGGQYHSFYTLAAPDH